jgi:replicative DNA helicase
MNNNDNNSEKCNDNNFGTNPFNVDFGGNNKTIVSIRNYHENDNVNSDLEALILAYVFFYIKPEYFQPIMGIVNENHFFFREHKSTFVVLKTAFKQGLPLHIKTVKPLFNLSDFECFADKGLDYNNGLDKYLDKLMFNVELGVDHLDIEKLCWKLIDLYKRRNFIDVLIESTKNFNDAKLTTQEVLIRVGKGILDIDKESSMECDPPALPSLMSGVFESVKKLYHSESKEIPVGEGVSTGFTDLDNIIGGLRNSDLTIIGARTSMGKTAFAINLALNISKKLQEQQVRQSLLDNTQQQKKRKFGNVLFFSLEMSSKQIAERILALETGVNLSKMLNGAIRNDELQKIERCLESMNKLGSLNNLYIDDHSAPKVIDIERRVQRLALSSGLSVVVIDYLQMVSSDKRNSTREREVAEVVAGIKNIAKKYNVPVILVSQLSRASEIRENKRPYLSDLRDSGSIEQDADLVLLLYREEYYLMNKKPKDDEIANMAVWQAQMERCANKCEVIVAKHRNGATGHVTMGFDKEIMRFYSV